MLETPTWTTRDNIPPHSYFLRRNLRLRQRFAGSSIYYKSFSGLYGIYGHKGWEDSLLGTIAEIEGDEYRRVNEYGHPIQFAHEHPIDGEYVPRQRKVTAVHWSGLDNWDRVLQIASRLGGAAHRDDTRPEQLEKKYYWHINLPGGEEIRPGTVVTYDSAGRLVFYSEEEFQDKFEEETSQ